MYRCQCEAAMQQHQEPTSPRSQDRQEWLLLHDGPKQHHQLWVPQVQGQPSHLPNGHMQEANQPPCWPTRCHLDATKAATCHFPPKTTTSIPTLHCWAFCLWTLHQMLTLTPFNLASLCMGLCAWFMIWLRWYLCVVMVLASSLVLSCNEEV